MSKRFVFLILDTSFSRQGLTQSIKFLENICIFLYCEVADTNLQNLASRFVLNLFCKTKWKLAGRSKDTGIIKIILWKDLPLFFIDRLVHKRNDLISGNGLSVFRLWFAESEKSRQVFWVGGTFLRVCISRSWIGPLSKQQGA